jgi:hypothetical protein
VGVSVADWQIVQIYGSQARAPVCVNSQHDGSLYLSRNSIIALSLA